MKMFTIMKEIWNGDTTVGVAVMMFALGLFFGLFMRRCTA